MSSSDASLPDQPNDLPVALPALALLLAAAVTLSGAGSGAAWYLVRASGIIAYLLLTATVAAGLLTSSRAMPPGTPRLDLFEVHNFTALLAVCFGVFHASALLFDSFVGFSPGQILVPFTSTYRPVAVALGIGTLYLSALVYLSFRVRRLIGQKAWRAFHYTAFVAYVLGTLHGIFAGSDTSALWMVGIYFGSGTVVASLVFLRLLAAEEAKLNGGRAAASAQLIRDSRG